MKMAKLLPLTLQIKHAKKFFCNLNPPCDAIDDIDFKHAMDKTLSYAENIENLSYEYPEYRWSRVEEIKPKTYEKMFIESLREQAEPLSYDVVKSYKLEDLERKARKLGKTEKKLTQCRLEAAKPRKTRPGVCRVKTVRVKAYKRCLPRQRS